MAKRPSLPYKAPHADKPGAKSTKTPTKMSAPKGAKSGSKGKSC